MALTLLAFVVGCGFGAVVTYCSTARIYTVGNVLRLARSWLVAQRLIVEQRRLKASQPRQGVRVALEKYQTEIEEVRALALPLMPPAPPDFLSESQREALERWRASDARRKLLGER